MTPPHGSAPDSLSARQGSGLDLREALVAALEACCRDPLALAFSGGTESVVLAHLLGGMGRPFTAFVLETPRGHRDAASAARAADALGIELHRLCVGEDDVLACIAEHRILLRDLPNHTHRILAVCEIFLARFALRQGRTLVTGHGPESVLGGFRRRPMPSLDDRDAIRASLAANTDRLRRVEAAVGCRIVLPFVDERVLAALVAMRSEGLDKAALPARAGCPHAPPAKSSLQNGSGVHYLFEDMARRNGHRLTRDYMEALLG